MSLNTPSTSAPTQRVSQLATERGTIKVPTTLTAAVSTSRAPTAAATSRGAFAALGGQHVGVAGMDVAPAQVGLETPGQDRVAGVVGASHDEGADRPELCLDRIGPGGAGRGEAQFDVGAGRPAADRRGLVRR